MGFVAAGGVEPGWSGTSHALPRRPQRGRLQKEMNRALPSAILASLAFSALIVRAIPGVIQPLSLEFLEKLLKRTGFLPISLLVERMPGG